MWGDPAFPRSTSKAAHQYLYTAGKGKHKGIATTTNQTSALRSSSNSSVITNNVFHNRFPSCFWLCYGMEGASLMSALRKFSSWISNVETCEFMVLTLPIYLPCYGNWNLYIFSKGTTIESLRLNLTSSHRRNQMVNTKWQSHSRTVAGYTNWTPLAATLLNENIIETTRKSTCT